MSLTDFLKAFFTHPTVLAYWLMAAIGGGLAIHWAEAVWPPVVATTLMGLLYPLPGYGLHRYVLHGRVLFKGPLTPSLLERIPFDHHRDPPDLSVVFGGRERTH